MATSDERFAKLTSDNELGYLKRVSILVFLATFMFLLLANATTLLSEPIVYYSILLLFLIGIMGLYEGNMRDRRLTAMQSGEKMDAGIEIIPWEHFRLSSLPMQVIGGFLLLLIYLIPVVLIGNIAALGPIPIDGFFRTLFMPLVMVGMIEALLLIIYVRVVFKGIFVFPFIFAFLHPQVGPLWMQGIVTNQSILFFFSAVLFGFVFIGIFLARDVLKPPQIRDKETNELITLGRGNAYKLFGAVSMAVFHGGINTISIIASANIGGIGI
jgi:hypothetical protein